MITIELKLFFKIIMGEGIKNLNTLMRSADWLVERGDEMHAEMYVLIDNFMASRNRCWFCFFNCTII